MGFFYTGPHVRDVVARRLWFSKPIPDGASFNWLISCSYNFCFMAIGCGCRRRRAGASGHVHSKLDPHTGCCWNERRFSDQFRQRKHVRRARLCVGSSCPFLGEEVQKSIVLNRFPPWCSIRAVLRNWFNRGKFADQRWNKVLKHTPTCWLKGESSQVKGRLPYFKSKSIVP